MKGNWVLPVILVIIHFALVVLFFVGIEASSDGEVVMAWGLFRFIDFPISILTGEIDQIFWKKEILWYNKMSLIFQFSRRMGWDHLNVGAAIMYFIGGTLQWFTIGLILSKRRKVKAT